MFVNAFYGLLLVGVGFLVLKYRKVVHEWTGGWYWAEKYLGRWGTLTALGLISLAMIGFGVAAMFGAVRLVPGGPTDGQTPSTQRSPTISISSPAP